MPKLAQANLFDEALAPVHPTTGYSARDIEVLEGLEPVRKRPGMYIGGVDERALHHLFAEVLDNSMDEAVAGHARVIEVSFDVDGALTVRDDGRGMPVDPHPKFPGKSAMEVILTVLHSGGKFSGKAYETSGGLHGVGVSVVNALSDRLEAFEHLDVPRGIAGRGVNGREGVVEERGLGELGHGTDHIVPRFVRSRRTRRRIWVRRRPSRG